MPSATSPTPQERFEIASKHAALLRALFNHPKTVHDDDQRAQADRSKMPLTLWNVLDFQHATYTKYLMPLLPPDATKHSKALANPWDYVDPKFCESPELMADDLYPRMKVGGLQEKWQDAVGRGTMIAMIIGDRSKHMMFGGPFEFGPEIEAAARAL